ncbi:MAG TPA: hypothetical protein PKI03_31770 [Pseudomonadota bacterium]|nr:hypothetical protein [Pseudomonadota bacterium]
MAIIAIQLSLFLLQLGKRYSVVLSRVPLQSEGERIRSFRRCTVVTRHFDKILFRLTLCQQGLVAPDQQVAFVFLCCPLRRFEATPTGFAPGDSSDAATQGVTELLHAPEPKHARRNDRARLTILHDNRSDPSL